MLPTSGPLAVCNDLNDTAMISSSRSWLAGLCSHDLVESPTSTSTLSQRAHKLKMSAKWRICQSERSKYIQRRMQSPSMRPLVTQRAATALPCPEHFTFSPVRWVFWACSSLLRRSRSCVCIFLRWRE